MTDMTLYDTKPLAHSNELDAVTKGLAGGNMSGGFKRLSIKGSRFRRIVGGEQVDVSKDPTLEVVIVASAPSYVRTYYAGAYVEGETPNPACWSDDCEVPSPNCQNPANDSCRTCEWNVKGSSADGKGRACKYAARMAIVLGGDLDGDVYGLQIPATSIWADDGENEYRALQNYARKLADHGYPATKVLTEICFDDNSPVPKLFFRPLSALSDGELASCARAAETLDAKQHTGPRTFGGTDGEAVHEGGTGDNGFTKDPALEQKKAPAKKKAVAKKKAAAKKKPKPEPEPEVVQAEEVEEADDGLGDILSNWADD